MINHGFQRSRLGEKMARTWHDLQRLWRPQARQRLLIELYDAKIVASDDQKGRRANSVKRTTGEIRTAATRNHCTDAVWKFRRDDECSRRSRAGAEQSEWKPSERRLPFHPVHSIDEPVCQQRNVEYVGPIGLLCWSQEIKQ